MNDIDRAVQVLRSGGLVAFPTETVYGLGADATNAAAVRRIFAAKGRPGTNPLIVHVADADAARHYVSDWGEAARALAAAWWPGPLTLVLPKAPAIAPEVTAGRPNVALRVPNHPRALELLRAFGGPVAAPSANRSNRVSPTTTGHVREELGDAVDLVLDGGPCEVGIESTVLDLSQPRPAVLRPGAVTRAQIESLIGPVDQFAGSVAEGSAAASPGQSERHYAPETPAVRFEAAQRGQVPAVEGTSRVVIGAGEGVRERGGVVEMPGLPAAYARHFYAVLRKLDGSGLRTIYIEMPPDEPAWLAVRDRIQRATLPM